MSGKQVSVNLFDIGFPENNSYEMIDAIRLYQAMPLDRRWRNDIRLDDIEEYQYLAEDVVLLNFSKKRDVGPGKVKNDSPVEGVDLGNGYSFSEETTALYVPRTNSLLLIGNSHGIGINRITEYMNAVDPGNSAIFLNFYGEPRLNPAAHAQFKKMKSIDKIIVTASISALAQDQHDAGVSLCRASQSLGSRRIHFEMSANEGRKREHTMKRGPVMSLLKKLRKLDDEVTVLKVKGQVGQRDKMIDLIQQKLTQKFSARELIVINNKYTLASKKNILQRTLTGWKSILEMK